MISIIISSANKQLLADVCVNIANTIGIAHEIISIDNADGRRGICEIYNIGVSKAQYNVLCFMHEDLDIKTQNWGQLIVEKFESNKKLGIIGVAGSSYKSKAPSGWWAQYPGSRLTHCSYIQRYKFNDEPSRHILENPLGEILAPVVSVDGLWFCTTKSIARQFPFDEHLLKGFHCYDLDFCFQVAEHFDIVVTFDVLMEHFSEGGYRTDWWLNTLKLHQKWQTELPKYTVELSNVQRRQVEENAYTEVIHSLEEMGYSKTYSLIFLTKQMLQGIMNWRMYFKMIKVNRRHFRYKIKSKIGGNI